jgi:AcrR family transcriptional regulator
VTDEAAPVWRGTTAEERTAPRRQKLIDAAFELLGDEGSPGATVRGVCAGAGLNPRYFYESFADLDELVAAVFLQVAAETNERSVAAIAAAPSTAEAKTRAAIDASLRYLADDPRRLRILFDASATHGALANLRAAGVVRAARGMAEQASRFYGIPPEDKLLTSTTIMLAGGLAELVLAWHQGRTDLTLDQLIDHATALIVGTSRAAGTLAAQQGLER